MVESDNQKTALEQSEAFRKEFSQLPESQQLPLWQYRRDVITARDALDEGVNASALLPIDEQAFSDVRRTFKGVAQGSDLNDFQQQVVDKALSPAVDEAVKFVDKLASQGDEDIAESIFLASLQESAQKQLAYCKENAKTPSFNWNAHMAAVEKTSEVFIKKVIHEAEARELTTFSKAVQDWFSPKI